MTIHERIFLGIIAILITMMLAAMTFIGSQNTARLDRIEGKLTDSIKENTRFQLDIVGRVSKVEVLLGSWDARYYPDSE